MRAIFVVTSQGKDTYSAMTRLAIASLRSTNPSFQVTVACDSPSSASIAKSGDPIFQEADDVLVVSTPEGSDIFRNRFIKTSLRNRVDGSFVFLDSDVFVRGSLKSLFDADADIGAARNHSRPERAEQIWTGDQETLDSLSWRVSDRVYFNGGVLFYADTQGARMFATDWHRRWLEVVANLGTFRDQPALNAALFATQPRTKLLADSYNAQFKANPSVALGATLWHYYSSDTSVMRSQLESLVDRIVATGGLDSKAVADLIRSPHPWYRDILGISDFAARKIGCSSIPAAWEVAALSGRFPAFLKTRAVGQMRTAGSRVRRLLTSKGTI